MENFFISDELLNATASICRVLSRPESHLVLVGSAGGGKIECIHIACTQLYIKFFTLSLVKNYSMDDFFADLKLVSLLKMY